LTESYFENKDIWRFVNEQSGGREVDE